MSTVPGPDDRNICKIIANKETKPHTSFIWIFVTSVAIQIILLLMFLDARVALKIVSSLLCYGIHLMVFNKLKDDFLLAISHDDIYSYTLGGRLVNGWSLFSYIVVMIAVFRFW